MGTYVRKTKQFKNERHFMQHVIYAAKQHGWKCFHSYSSIKGNSGYPDLTLVKPHQPVIFAELKSDVGQLTVEQRRWAAAIELSLGVEYRIWRPRDWEWILQTLMQESRHGK